MSESEGQAPNPNEPQPEGQEPEQPQAMTPDEIAALVKRAETAESQRDEARKDAGNYRTKLRTAETAAQDAERAKAQEAGNFQALYESEQQTTATLTNRITELEGQIAAEQRAALRARIASAHKLPDDLVDLLQGDDEAALVASAKRLAKHLQPQAPDTEAGQNRRPASRPERRPSEPGTTTEGTPQVAWPA